MRIQTSISISGESLAEFFKLNGIDPATARMPLRNFMTALVGCLLDDHINKMRKSQLGTTVDLYVGQAGA